ncbi:hypothetical protein PFICI_03788 [Pestalotiopsis fici W106-1]|uniref:Uncharacterized protein n=1 Tax=Pestalotiopsis fici (strain W106-1 / CGMCC3.15140) TaxID=1229662 RepID=W3XI82_PESFW|nr:uncharacterized protein PFICI_03788 [Pestalotiopsis fici W106-1]ETS85763.1 hypothetical protein PFICI_03788 [Pestalotiopsis fici W106-1]
MATLETPSTPGRLETLPTVVLDFICEILADCDSRRRSLFAFSLVNKRCCAVADRQRFERIQCKVRGSSELREDIERWTSLLETSQQFRHVRKVKVIGFMPPDSLETEEDWVVSLKVAVERSARYDREERAGEGSDHDGFFDPPVEPVMVDVAESHLDTQEAKKQHNEAWQPFADFISRLPALRDLVYSCADQVPPCLLAALHQHHPQSRLHVHTFALRSLLQKHDEIRDIDLDEYALITSPCLYSVLLYTSRGYITTGHVNYNHEALFAMASGVSPGLRHVRTNTIQAGNSPALLRAARAPRPEWRGFFMNNNGTTYAKGQLESISIIGQGSSVNLGVAAWARITDFRKLRSLEHATHESTTDDLNMLVLMASNGQLGQLRKLSLQLNASQHVYPYMEANLAVLLEHLPPLEELSITGPHGPMSLSAITRHQGASLQKLKLVPDQSTTAGVSTLAVVDSSHLVNQLQRYCPNLRQLELMLPRSKGDEREVALYQALGKFKSLTHLTILLDCCYQQWMNLHSIPPSRELIRDIFINATVDAALARSIFNFICTADPSAPSPLRVMRSSVLWCDYADIFGDSAIYNLLSWVGRSWLCQRYPRLDQTGEITVDEIQRSHRYEQIDITSDEWDDFSHGSELKQIWRELWPEKTDIRVTDCTSFPLMNASG